MTEILSIVIPIVLIVLLIRLIMTPMKLLWKLLINAACGFVCLFLLNLLSGITGMVFELNFLSSLLVGFLGLPGIVLLILSRFLL